MTNAEAASPYSADFESQTPESFDVNDEDRRKDVEEKQRKVRQLIRDFKGILPRQIYVGIERPYDNETGIESNWKVIAIQTARGEMYRQYFSEEPKVLYDKTTGTQSIENMDQLITGGSARDIHWTRFGQSAIEKIETIATDRGIKAA